MRDPRLEAAYRATEYHVRLPQRLVLRIDQPEARLFPLLAQTPLHCAAYLTACNPASQRLSESENAERMHALASQLKQKGYDFLHGMARDPHGEWPDEASFLVLGIPPTDACELAQDYAQNALLLIAADACPRLHWLI
ncbi:MAG: DUF3293 domain-containing protein [Betaproteobacteria bacterium]|nr:DUF3293 domain-containing protein [Betaproteobacteria bacterium]